MERKGNEEKEYLAGCRSNQRVDEHIQYIHSIPYYIYYSNIIHPLSGSGLGLRLPLFPSLQMLLPFNWYTWGNRTRPSTIYPNTVHTYN